jgi:hypothetical protein
MADQPIQDLPDAKYGENQEYVAQQKVMPGAAAQGLPPAPQPKQVVEPGGPVPTDQPSAPVDPLGAFMGPSSRPAEPITAGAPVGPGPNSLALGPNAPVAPDTLSRTLAAYGAADDTGIVAQLAQYFDGMSI